MTEIALRASTDSWADMLNEVGDLAARVSTTSFVPTGIRGKTAEIAACILTGREIGIGPMTSLNEIHVINGRPCMSSKLMRSLAFAAGHEITFPVLTDEKVTAKGRRADSDQWTEVTWTMKDAQRIGVASRDTWKSYPRAMLQARASSELCRLLFPDALGGVSYAMEELDDEQTTTARTSVRRNKARTSEPVPEVTEPELAPENPQQAQESGASVTEVAEVTEETPEPDIVDAEIVEEVLVSQVMDGKGMTSLQGKILSSRLGVLGWDKAQAIAYATDMTGRPISKSEDLTKDEAQKIIDALGALKEIAALADE
jgi:hypothetical protein